MPDPLTDAVAQAPEWLRALTQIGITGLLALFGYALYKGWLVSKQTHDAALDVASAQLNAQRTAYEKQLADERAEFDQRLGEWRRFRDEERARAIESDQRLRVQVELSKELSGYIGDARAELYRLSGLLAHYAEQHGSEARGVRGAPDAT
jgi:hypothetical protein